MQQPISVLLQPARQSILAGWEYRILNKSDAPAILEAFNSNEDMQRQGDVVDLPTAQAYVDSKLNHERVVALAAVDEDDQVRALAVANYYSRENKTAWIYYWAHAKVRGQGITSALVKNLANWMFDECGVERLELGYRLNNPASAQVAKRAGFIVEGVERGKFLIDGQRIDSAIASRLYTDPRPGD